MQAREETQRHKVAEDKYRTVQEQKRREADEQVGHKRVATAKYGTAQMQLDARK